MGFIANRIFQYDCGVYGSGEYGRTCINSVDTPSESNSDSIIGWLPVSGTNISVILIFAGILIVSGVLARHFAKKRRQTITN